QDTNIAHGIQRIAEQKDITQIILGKPLKRKFSSFFGTSLVHRLSKINSTIDIHIVRQSLLFPKKKKKFKRQTLLQHLKTYAYMLFWIAVFTAFNGMIVHHVGYKVVGSVFLLSILFLSLFFKRGPILFAAFMYALIWNFFF